MIIDTFGSSNIKKIANLLKKNEATIYYHIKELVQVPELLQIDEEMTRLRKGKFYKLSPLAITNFTDVEESEASEETLQKYDKLIAETDEVVNTCYWTSETPPTASTTTEGAIYIQYTA